MTQQRVASKVEEDTVEGLAKGYIVNTYELYKCNVQLKGIEDWSNKQQEIYNDNRSK